MIPPIQNVCQHCDKTIAGVPQRCSVCKGSFYCDVSTQAGLPTTDGQPQPAMTRPNTCTPSANKLINALHVQVTCQKGDWVEHKKECSSLPADLSPAVIELSPELEDEVAGAKRRVAACLKSWRVSYTSTPCAAMELRPV